MAITDAWLKANSGKERAVVEEKTDRDGLSVRVSKKGKIVFQLRFRHDRKQARVDIGTYPLIALKQAREEVLKYKAELEKGYDPRIVKKTDKIKNIEAADFKSIFLKWFDAYCSSNKKGANDIKRSFELYVLPRFGTLPPDKISTDNWLTLLEEITKNKPGIAVRILTNSKQMLSWSVRRRLIAGNVLSDINAKQDLNIVKRPGLRSLNNEEIKMLMLFMENSRMATKNKLFIKLCLIYGCRNGELRLSKKRDFDFEKMTWTVPPENHKMGETTGKPLIRPITDDIKLILEECLLLSEPGDYLFNNVGTNKPMGRSSPGALPYNVMQWIRKNLDYEMQHWSMHDLRKTARTNFSTLTQPHVAEIMLGHKIPGEWMTYDHHDYLEEQAECLVKWSERLNTLRYEN